MENTTENKLRFFALYFGQDFLRHKNWKLASDKISGISSLLSKNYHLELRSIDSITDDECVEYYNLKHINSKFLVMAVEDKTKVLDIKKEVGWLKFRADFTRLDCDFFRSKGFLVPFMNLTTDQIIEFGWAKIKEQ